MKSMYLSLVAMAGLGSALAAQTVTDNSASSSVSYFSESKVHADGGTGGSSTYAATVTVGHAEPASSSSSTYALSGGFGATLGVVSVTPWITSATPMFVTPRTSQLVWLAGTRLNVGAPSVAVSGKPGSVAASSPTDVAFHMPSISAPGWHEIKLSNNLGTTSLERGIGVLPMLFTEGAAASDEPFDLVFKGTQNDIVVWALGFAGGPPIPIKPYLHGLMLYSSFIRVLPTFSLAAPSGEFRLPVPPVPFAFTIYAQALFLSNNPGYSPGSFTNMLTF